MTRDSGPDASASSRKPKPVTAQTTGVRLVANRTARVPYRFGLIVTVWTSSGLTRRTPRMIRDSDRNSANGEVPALDIGSASTSTPMASISPIRPVSAHITVTE